MAQEYQIFLPSVGSAQQPRLRLGVGIAHYQTHDWLAHTLRLLKPACWQDWLWDHYDKESGYIPTVFSMRIGSVLNGRAADAARNTNRMWQLGNEPEQGSSLVAPEVAAAFSRDWQANVGTSFAAPGIVMWAKGLAWLHPPCALVSEMSTGRTMPIAAICAFHDSQSSVQ